MQFYIEDTLRKPHTTVKLKDSTQAQNFIISFYQSKIKSKHWGYSIDSVYRSKHFWKILYYPGLKIKNIIYKNKNLPGPIFEDLIKNYGKEIPEKFALQSTQYMATIGFPFTEIYLDSITQHDGIIEMDVLARKNSIVFFSKILNDNESLKIAPSFFYSLIGIRPFERFDISKINAIPERIKNLGYFELTDRPNFIIQDSFCVLNVSLKEIKRNRFDGILGILPNSETSGELQLTGDVQVSLQNLFLRGIGLNLNWQKLQPFSQSLNIQFEYPYLFKKPININTQFKLLKQDTSFITIDWKVGLGFIKSTRSTFEASLQSTSSSLISVDTSFVFTKTLPTKLDFQNFYGGLNYKYKKTDQQIISRKGLKIEFNILAGYKKINKNEEVVKRLDQEGRSLAYLYDGVNNPTFNAQLGFKIDHALPLKQYFSFKSTFQSKVLFSQNILKNENFRIGGNKLLRGFDEENIYTPYFLFASEEIRWFVSNRSYMYTFIDIAMVQDNRFKNIQQDFPIGTGIGIALNTKGGIFGVSYAIGKQLNNSFDFRSSKIHFGYINEF